MAAIFLLSTEIKVGRVNEKQDISIFQDYDGTMKSARNNYYSSWIWILSLKNSPFKISSQKNSLYSCYVRQDVSSLSAV